MTQIVIRGEVVYKCNVCNRRARFANNSRGLDVINNCTITANCLGKLTRVNFPSDVLSTPTLVPSVPGLNDWYQRKLLYTHTQSVPMKVWTIYHNLSNNPTFDVLVDNGSGMVSYSPDVKIIDKNTSTLTFNKSYSGIAQAISLSSQLTPTPVNLPSGDLVQISTNTGLLTIATIISSSIVDLSLDYHINNISNTVNTLIYSVDDQPQSTSPWNSANTVYIHNTLFTVRSVETVLDQNNYHYFASNEITSGSSVTMLNINNSTPQPKSILILLSTSPHGAVDRIYDKVIYFDQIQENQIIYNNGILFATPDIIKDIYPYIVVV